MAYQHPGPGPVRPTPVFFTRPPTQPIIDSDDDLSHLARWGRDAWAFLRSCLIFFLLLYFFGHACNCADANAAATDPPTDDEIARYCNDQCLEGIPKLCGDFGYPLDSAECNCGMLTCEAACECAATHGEEACAGQNFTPQYCVDLIDPPSKTD